MWNVLAIILLTVVVISPAVEANGASPRHSREAGAEAQEHDGGEHTEDAHRPVPPPPDSQLTHQVEGIASWYGGKFQGRLTANGEVFDTNELTAAHRTLPFDTIVRVTNQDTNQSVEVRINDRGPFVDNRVIDLSRAAASRIGLTASGIAPVELEIINYVPESNSRVIQIASFSRRENAQTMVARLIAEDLPAAVETAEEQNAYRVILTDVHTRDVEDYRSRLESLGFRSILVRRN
ncbi:MAG: septal ring lytic transglycosylase RlpA family protein [Alkalispirochaeta sp.]